MANAYNEEAGDVPAIVELAVKVAVVAIAILSTVPVMIWLPYTIFTDSIWRDGGVRVLVILWMVGMSLLNRRMAEADLPDSSPLFSWMVNRFGVWGFIILFNAWQVMMVVPLFATLLADRGYIRESISWYIHFNQGVVNFLT